MALFTNRADRDLPILTQFYALELPEGWEQNSAKLLGSELSHWLGLPRFDTPAMRFLIFIHLLCLPPPNQEVLAMARDSEAEVACGVARELIQAMEHLSVFAKVHGTARRIMNAIADGGDFLKEDVLLVNSLLQKTMSDQQLFVYDEQKPVMPPVPLSDLPPGSVFRPADLYTSRMIVCRVERLHYLSFLETSWNLAFYFSMVMLSIPGPDGKRLLLLRCHACNNVYVKTSRHKNFCSARCYNNNCKNYIRRSLRDEETAHRKRALRKPDPLPPFFPRKRP